MQWFHHSPITQSPAGQEFRVTASGGRQKCQFSSVFRVDSLALGTLLEADGPSITPGKECENFKLAGVNKLFGTELYGGKYFYFKLSPPAGMIFAVQQ